MNPKRLFFWVIIFNDLLLIVVCPVLCPLFRCQFTADSHDCQPFSKHLPEWASGSKPNFSDFLKHAPELWLRRDAQCSIRIHEGEPNLRKAAGDIASGLSLLIPQRD